MKLRCPYCDKVVEVADNLAGQTTKCNFCQGPFTVPLLPPDLLPPPVTSAGPGNAAPADRGAAFDTTLPYPEPSPAAEPTPASAPSPEMTSLRKKLAGVAEKLPGRVIFRCDPSWLEWVAPVGLLLLFFLLFFTWVSMDFGSQTLASQGGFGVAFGSLSSGITALASSGTVTSSMIGIYVLVTVLGFFAAAGLIFAKLAPPDLRGRAAHLLGPLQEYRRPILLGVVGIGFVCILFQTLLGFPLQTAWTGQQADAALHAGLKLALDGEFKMKAGAGEALLADFVHSRWAWHLTQFISLICVLAVLLDWMLDRRGLAGTPKLELAWGLESDVKKS